MLGVSLPIERPPNRRPAVFAVLLIRRVNRSVTFRRSPATVRVAVAEMISDIYRETIRRPDLRRRSRSFSCASSRRPTRRRVRSVGVGRRLSENDAVRGSGRAGPADAAARADRSRNDSAERCCEGSAAPCSATERPLPAGSTGDHGGGYRTTGASPGAMRASAARGRAEPGPGRGPRHVSDKARNGMTPGIAQSRYVSGNHPARRCRQRPRITRSSGDRTISNGRERRRTGRAGRGPADGSVASAATFVEIGRETPLPVRSGPSSAARSERSVRAARLARRDAVA